MATTAEFRNGLCIQHNGEPWKIESFQHVKPGKGPAFVRTKLRNLNSGRLLENTFTAGVKIEIIRIENRKYQFLYSEGNNYHLMNNDDYEQIMLQKDFISNVEFLKEGNLCQPTYISFFVRCLNDHKILNDKKYAQTHTAEKVRCYPSCP